MLTIYYRQVGVSHECYPESMVNGSIFEGLLTGWIVCVRRTRRLNLKYSSLLGVVSIAMMYFAIFAPFCHQVRTPLPYVSKAFSSKLLSAAFVSWCIEVTHEPNATSAKVSPALNISIAMANTVPPWDFN